MRILIYLIGIFSLNAIVASAQVNSEERFAKVDDYVSQVNKEFIFHPQALAQRLSENQNNDYDKVRAFYVWIARNIDYDLLAYIHNLESSQSVTEITRSGKALCTGFSLLFLYFCEQAGIEALIVEGYAKGYGYKNGQKFDETNHAWNAVNIYGTWHLLDATWATGDPTKISKHQKQIDLNTYFLMPPEQFIKTHLPEDPTWQLLANKISLSEFESDESQNTGEKKYDTYDPEDYRNLNEYDRDLLIYKRALEFNQRNDRLYTSLAFAYLYKGISLTDELWKLHYNELLDQTDQLEKEFAAYLDSAWITINEPKHLYARKSKRIVNDEINYQKGVFNYELGVELYSKSKFGNTAEMPPFKVINNYFENAAQYFNKVDKASIYYKDANEYLALIREFRQRFPAETPGD
jgi:hypothetical protein